MLRVVPAGVRLLAEVQAPTAVRVPGPVQVLKPVQALEPVQVLASEPQALELGPVPLRAVLA